VGQAAEEQGCRAAGLCTGRDLVQGCRAVHRAGPGACPLVQLVPQPGPSMCRGGGMRVTHVPLLDGMSSGCDHHCMPPAGLPCKMSHSRCHCSRPCAAALTCQGLAHCVSCLAPVGVRVHLAAALRGIVRAAQLIGYVIHELHHLGPWLLLLDVLQQLPAPAAQRAMLAHGRPPHLQTYHTVMIHSHDRMHCDYLANVP
jgi:hypothetical protein